MLILAIVVAALLLYGASGHGPHQLSPDEGTAGAVAGLCLLLFTVLGIAVRTRMATNDEPRRAEAVLVSPTWPVQIVVDRRARASPITLQRFRN